MDRPRIFLADDHAEILAAVARLLAEEFDVVRTFKDGQEIVDAADMLDSDLVVMDVSMPRLNGIEAARQLRAVGCQAKIVFLTVHKDQDYVRSALATGALGYVIKDRLVPDLVPALREALVDHRFVSDCIAPEPTDPATSAQVESP